MIQYQIESYFYFFEEADQMAKYNTVQREQLIRFLKKNQSNAMTVIDITNMMRIDPETEKAPGESTVYRLIKELVEEGAVKRTVKGCSREFLYQMTDSETCRMHLHMKCTVCGNLFHMNDSISENLINSLLESEGFYLDRSMVLSGVCKNCR